ncbi:MAG: helix-turn-helix transcriptional regulator [Pirellulales bacterium]
MAGNAGFGRDRECTCCRVRELLLVCRFAELVHRHAHSRDELIQAVVEHLPAGWQYPDICYARVVFEGKPYATANFRTSPWEQCEDLEVAGKRVGTVEVGYLRKKPDCAEGPFLREERGLLRVVAEHLGRILERLQSERQLRDALAALEAKHAALQQANAAVRAVWTRIEEEKNEIRQSTHANVEKILIPTLHGLEDEVPPHLKGRMALVKQGLEEIVSPFVDHLSKTCALLTPVEIAVANLIKNGLGTKEIARLRHISPATVARHREHIRKKLGITNSKANLISYLRDCLGETSQQTVTV